MAQFTADELQDYADGYRQDLDEFLQFWENTSEGIDHVRGGFWCGLSHDGKRNSDNKFCWFQGRGLWVWAHLLADMGAEGYRSAKRFEIAQKTRDFILAFLREPGADGRPDWRRLRVSVEGNGTAFPKGPTAQPADPDSISTTGYGIAFCAEGLQEYHLALVRARGAGDEEALVEAHRALRAFVAMMDDPGRAGGEGYLPRPHPGVRSMGHHMILLRLVTNLLRTLEATRAAGLERCADAAAAVATADELEALARRCAGAIMERFYNPHLGLINEALPHDYAPYAEDDTAAEAARDPGGGHDPNGDFVYLGHAIEALWMVMDEAVRTRDGALFDLAAHRLRAHLERAWDAEGGGGIIRSCHARSPDADAAIHDKWGKVLWAQEEAMIGCLMVAEHAPDAHPWAAAWFRKVYDYTQRNFRLEPHGFPGYKVGGGRDVAFEESYNMGYPAVVNRKEHYHLPRELMLCHKIVARLRRRRGGGAPAHRWRADAPLPLERRLRMRDGLVLAARVWGDSGGREPDERWLFLHGWLDNAASFDRLAPLLLAQQARQGQQARQQPPRLARPALIIVISPGT